MGKDLQILDTINNFKKSMNNKLNAAFKHFKLCYEQYITFELVHDDALTSFVDLVNAAEREGRKVHLILVCCALLIIF